jgi:hypothetical protein
MKVNTGIFIGIAMVVTFSLGRLMPAPQPIVSTHFAEPAPKQKEWFEAYSEVDPNQSFTQNQAPQVDRSEMILRAYYLNAMREQAIRRQQQWIDAELEARRINGRVGDYDPNRWRNPYHY